MYSMVPVEMVDGAMQLAVYFVTALGALLGLMISVRP